MEIMFACASVIKTDMTIPFVICVIFSMTIKW